MTADSVTFKLLNCLNQKTNKKSLMSYEKTDSNRFKTSKSLLFFIFPEGIDMFAEVYSLILYHCHILRPC